MYPISISTCDILAHKASGNHLLFLSSAIMPSNNTTLCRHAIRKKCSHAAEHKSGLLCILATYHEMMSLEKDVNICHQTYVS
ncbi:hypothetical protein QQF64_035186 [Cirrhinus molitorella]|uniref:Uncharacterized protein n=1 Tax=Cirrhinus molitorella TaxID=172907 RepID=A0ABR3NF31_9TELE